MFRTAENSLGGRTTKNASFGLCCIALEDSIVQWISKCPILILKFVKGSKIKTKSGSIEFKAKKNSRNIDKLPYGMQIYNKDDVR